MERYRNKDVAHDELIKLFEAAANPQPRSQRSHDLSLVRERRRKAAVP
jgi:hypothetical protein